MSVSAITVGPGKDLHAGSLLHEQISVSISATVKGKQKEYDWIAKIHRSEHESANYARFQVFIYQPSIDITFSNLILVVVFL